MASQPHIQVLPLGAGQDVGRSCVVVTMSGRTVMFDCGMHVGYRDERRCVDAWVLHCLFHHAQLAPRLLMAISPSPPTPPRTLPHTRLLMVLAFPPGHCRTALFSRSLAAITPLSPVIIILLVVLLPPGSPSSSCSALPVASTTLSHASSLRTSTSTIVGRCRTSRR